MEVGGERERRLIFASTSSDDRLTFHTPLDITSSASEQHQPTCRQQDGQKIYTGRLGRQLRLTAQKDYCGNLLRKATQ